MMFLQREDRICKINSKIPGPPNRLPIIGHLLLFIGVENPHLLFQDWYKKYGSVFYFKSGNINTVVLTGYPTLRNAFIENSELFAQRYQRKSRLIVGGGQSIGQMNGEQHKLIKSISLSLLTPTKIKQFESKFITKQIDQVIKKLDQHAISGEPFEIIYYLKMFSMNIIICFIFGINFPYDDIKKVTKISNGINKLTRAAGKPLISDIFNIPSMFSNIYWNTGNAKLYLDGIKELTNIMKEFIEKFKIVQLKNGEDNETILSKMINEYDKGKIENWDNVVGSCVDLFGAGLDTTSNTIAFCLVEIINNMEIQNKLYNSISNAISESAGNDKLPDNGVSGGDVGRVILTHGKYRNSIPYLSAVIKETHRKHAPTPLGIPHLLTEDIVIDGHMIAAGTQILQNIYATHRDEKCYPSPDKFIPERYTHSSSVQQSQSTNLIQYGIGVRDCLGKNLAESEIFTILATLINRYEFINPFPSTLLNDVGIFGATLRCPDSKIIIKKRKQ